MSERDRLDREMLGDAACDASDEVVAAAPALTDLQRDQLALLLGVNPLRDADAA